MRNKKIKYAFYSVICLLFVGCVVFTVKYIAEKKHGERSLTTIIALSEVTICEKWIEDDGMFVEISTNEEAPAAWDSYFFEPTTVMLESEKLYDSIEMGDTPYMSATMRIEIPYNRAKELELLDYNDTIIIEKILDSKEYVQSYCTLVSIRRD